MILAIQNHTFTLHLHYTLALLVGATLPSNSVLSMLDVMAGADSLDMTWPRTGIAVRREKGGILGKIAALSADMLKCLVTCSSTLRELAKIFLR